MSVKTIHKGYGVYDVFQDCVQIGICYKCNSGTVWTGKVKYKKQEVAISGINNIRDTTDRMGAIYNLLKHA